MGAWFQSLEIPSGPYLLKNASIPSGIAKAPDLSTEDDISAAHLLISDGKISRITNFAAVADIPSIDLRGSMVWPLFADCHTHIDKGHIWPRRPNPDGTFMGALESVRADSAANWTAEDLRARMSFSLKCAFAHGTRYLRTHIDSIGPRSGVSFPVFSELREEWKGRIDLQAACLVTPDVYLDPDQTGILAENVTAHGGMFGLVTFMMDGLDEALETVFRLAAEYGTDLDFHVDETLDPSAQSLEMIADIAIRTGFDGRILCGHCCSLAVQPEADADRVLDKLAQAEIDIVSLPMCNMYLQDRHQGRTPRRRGVTLLHEMHARGIRTAIASDNTRDPFYAYGDLDPLEVYREATRILQLDHPVGDWPGSITARAASVLGLEGASVLNPGSPADFVIFNARSWTELLSRPQSDRLVIRDGKHVKAELPDYRELDPVVGV